MSDEAQTQDSLVKIWSRLVPEARECKSGPIVNLPRAPATKSRFSPDQCPRRTQDLDLFRVWLKVCRKAELQQRPLAQIRALSAQIRPLRAQCLGELPLDRTSGRPPANTLHRLDYTRRMLWQTGPKSKGGAPRRSARHSSHRLGHGTCCRRHRLIQVWTS